MVKIKNLCMLVIVSFILLCLSSCDLDLVDIDEKYNGLSVGFTYENDSDVGFLVGAVRSNQTEFNINNVTLECSYGWYTYPPTVFFQTGAFDPVCVALYFAKGNLSRNSDFYDDFEDYQNIEDLHLLKEISIEKFSTAAFDVKQTKREGKIFDQKDSFTIPKEFLVKPRGGLYLIVVNIAWDPKENVYLNVIYGFREILYSFIDDETVRLYKK